MLDGEKIFKAFTHTCIRLGQFVRVFHVDAMVIVCGIFREIATLAARYVYIRVIVVTRIYTYG